LTVRGRLKANILDAGQAVRHISWASLWAHLRNHGYQTLFALLTMLLLVLLVMMPARPEYFLGDFSGDDSGCTPDGNVELAVGDTNSYKPFNRDGFFSINIKFGSLSFGLAKFVDIVWDVVS
jgi:hypothetical protein